MNPSFAQDIRIKPSTADFLSSRQALTGLESRSCSISSTALGHKKKDQVRHLSENVRRSLRDKPKCNFEPIISRRLGTDTVIG